MAHQQLHYSGEQLIADVIKDLVDKLANGCTYIEFDAVEEGYEPEGAEGSIEYAPAVKIEVY